MSSTTHRHLLLSAHPLYPPSPTSRQPESHYNSPHSPATSSPYPCAFATRSHHVLLVACIVEVCEGRPAFLFFVYPHDPPIPPLHGEWTLHDLFIFSVLLTEIRTCQPTSLLLLLFFLAYIHDPQPAHLFFSHQTRLGTRRLLFFFGFHAASSSDSIESDPCDLILFSSFISSAGAVVTIYWWHLECHLFPLFLYNSYSLYLRPSIVAPATFPSSPNSSFLPVFRIDNHRHPNTSFNPLGTSYGEKKPPLSSRFRFSLHLPFNFLSTNTSIHKKKRLANTMLG